jgi:outer membrane protein assembly factor BamB
LRPELTDRFRAFWYRTCIGLVVVSSLFTFTVAVVLSVNHLRLKKTDPLNAESIQALRDRFKADPRDQKLKAEIRQLDLLARRAWFGSVRFQEKGIYLLLAGSLVLVTSLKTVITIRRGKKGRTWLKQERSNILGHAWWVGTAVVTGIAAGALLLAVLGRPPPEPLGPQPTKRGEAVIAVSRVGSSPGQDHQSEESVGYWPSFRGPDGLSRAEAGPWPIQWDGGSGKGIVWKTPVPLSGRSSPVVWKDKIFLSGGDDETLEIYCFEVASGELIWRYQVQEAAPGQRPPVTDDTGHAASTMAVDGDRVYAVFSTGDLVAVDFGGNLAWQQDLGPPDNPYGHASSLIPYRGLIYILYDHRASSSLIALNGETGEIVWETFRDMEVSWTTPILIHAAGGDQLVVSGNPYVAAYEPLTGDEVWRLALLSGEVASSPAWAGSRVFAANEYATLAAISLGNEPDVVWEYGEDLPEVSSVLATGNHLYMANGSGTVTCLDQQDGTVLWRHEFEEGFYSSPVLAGGNIYILDRSGTMQIFADAESFQPVASSALGEAANCTAAFVDGRIYLRGEENLYCIGEMEPRP